jgi:hypothetical protein
MIHIFRTSFTQVFLISINTIFLSSGNWLGVTICSFAISYLWVTNVKKANISSKAEQIVYALGATFGGLSGLLITKFL